MAYCEIRFGPRRRSAPCGPSVRQRNDLVQAGARHIQRMQKALTQMNIQLANVLSDISGKSGQAIIHAILEGERDPYELAALCEVNVKASEEKIARALA